MGAKRTELLAQLWKAQDEAYILMYEYDTLPHHYGENVLYQAEGTMIDLIAANPGITITDLSGILKKTLSACSQTIRKLREKGMVEQIRNQENNRLFNLYLTESGMKVYEEHQAFNKDCQKKMFQLLEQFSDEDLARHVDVQKKINEAYAEDVRRSRERLEQQ